MDEEWRDIPGYEGHYQVSNQGRVKSMARLIPRSDGRTNRQPEKIMRPSLRTTGYWAFVLKLNSKGTNIAVHRMVLTAFVGPAPDGMICCHNDGNKLNNHLSNLRWDTYSSNLYDAVKHGTHWSAGKTHCKHGHELTPENTYTYECGRQCRTCAIARSKRRWAEARLAGSPRCLKESEFGVCHRRHSHKGLCATGIGPAFWFAWDADGSAVGYGRFSHGQFKTVESLEAAS